MSHFLTSHGSQVRSKLESQKTRDRNGIECDINVESVVACNKDSRNKIKFVTHFFELFFISTHTTTNKIVQDNPNLHFFLFFHLSFPKKNLKIFLMLKLGEGVPFQALLTSNLFEKYYWIVFELLIFVRFSSPPLKWSRP